MSQPTTRYGRFKERQIRYRRRQQRLKRYATWTVYVDNVKMRRRRDVSAYIGPQQPAHGVKVIEEHWDGQTWTVTPPGSWITYTYVVHAKGREKAPYVKCTPHARGTGWDNAPAIAWVHFRRTVATGRLKGIWHNGVPSLESTE